MRPANRWCAVAVVIATAFATLLATGPACAARLDGDDLAALIAPRLRLALGAQGLVVDQVRVTDPLALVVAEPVVLADLSVPDRVGNLASVPVTLRLDDATGSTRHELRVAVTARTALVVTTRAIAPGERLAGNVRLVSRPVAGFIAGLLRVDDLAAASAWTARRPLDGLQVVRAADLRRGPEVIEGEAVGLLRPSQPDALIPATALGTARRGERVAVQVFRGGRPVPARVVGPRTVELIVERRKGRGARDLRGEMR